MLLEAQEIDAKETNTIFKSSVIAIGKWEWDTRDVALVGRELV